MWVTTHVLAGLGIAAALGGPWWLIAVVVLLSHVLMDLIPHWDYTVSRHPVVYGVTDFAASFAAFGLTWLLLGYPWWIAFMGLASGAPDWDVLIWIARGEKGRKVFPSHWDSFPHGRSGKAWGISVQVAIMAVSVTVVLALAP